MESIGFGSCKLLSTLVSENLRLVFFVCINISFIDGRRDPEPVLSNTILSLLSGMENTFLLL